MSKLLSMSGVLCPVQCPMSGLRLSMSGWYVRSVDRAARFAVGACLVVRSASFLCVCPASGLVRCNVRPVSGHYYR